MDKQLNEYNEALAKLSDEDKIKALKLDRLANKLLELSEKLKLDHDENIRNNRHQK